MPCVLLSDNGAEFTAPAWEKCLSDLGIEHRKTTARHAQSNGKLERFHRTFKGLLSDIIDNQPLTWEDRVGDALAAYRISVSSVTGYSPFYLLYGRRPRMALEKTLSVRTNDHFDNRLDQLAQALQQARSNTADSRAGNRNRLKQRAFNRNG